MEEPDHSFSPETTRGLFRAIAVFTIVVPLLITAAVCGVLYLCGIPYERKQVKFICFVVWIGTLVALVGFAFLRRKGKRLRYVPASSGSPFTIKEASGPAEKWEQRNARRLSIRLYFVAILVPFLGIGLAALVLWLLDTPLTANDVETVAMAGWGSGLAIAIIYGLRSRKSVLGG